MKIEDIALLARLQLREDESRLFSEQFRSIIQYVEKLNELDTAGVEPTAHVLHLKNVFRNDEPRLSLQRSKAIQNAPGTEEGFYRVPKILE